MMTATPQKNTLIGMILRKQDLLTAQRESWYRIPVKSAPELVKSGALTTLALYQTKAFDEEKYSVRWWGAVSKIDREKRVELLPNEPAHPRANEEYFVVRVQSFEQLPKPVLSRIPRRNPFITTTDERLFATKDYNDLFYGSPLEETLWSALRKEGIPAQREYMVSRTAAKKKEQFYLDFVLFCKDVNIVSNQSSQKCLNTMRYVIIGTSGSGKSTFAEALAKAAQCSWTDLDALYWGEHWTAVSHEEFENAVLKATSPERWVVAGNYSSARDIVWGRATHIIWLNFNRWVVFSRVIMRTLQRILLRTELWNGNKESFQNAFFSHDSVILYSFTSFTRNRIKYAEVRQDPKYAHLQWIEMTKASQTQEFLEVIKIRSCK